MMPIERNASTEFLRFLLFSKNSLNASNFFPPQDESEVDADLSIPTSDPAANLQPAKPKDFTAFINLVEFCR